MNNLQMKTLIILGLIVSSISTVFSQNLQFPASIISAGGSSAQNSSTQISKWRIGNIYVIQFKSQDNKSSTIISGTELAIKKGEFEIKAYPNPVKDILQIQFNIDQSKSFGVKIIDIAGRKVLERKARLIVSNEVIQLDLQHLRPAIYIINVWSDDDSIYEIFKVSKQE